MNPLSRSIMDAYYLAAACLVQMSGSERRRLLRLARVLGALRTWVGYVGPRKSRGVFLAHMARAAPELSSSARRSLLRDFWSYHQLRFLDLFTVDRLSREELARWVHYDGMAHLDAALASGRGALVVTLHVGDARVAHVALGLAGYPVHLLSARYDDYGERARNARLRSSMKYHAVHFLDEPLTWAYRELRANHVVFLAISGYAGRRGIEVPFLNAPVVFSSAPARLASATGATIVPLVDIVDEAGIHRIRAFPALPPPAPSDTADLCTRRLVGIFEEVARTNLSQLDWIWYVIRCQERRGEVAPYEEGKIVRAARRGL